MNRSLWKRVTYILYKIIFVSFFVVIVVGEWAHATDFGPFQGRIVDADTKEPIEGAVVLVEWWKVPILGGGSIFIDAQETLTDKGGNFHVSGIWVFNPMKHYGTDAKMTIFKRGYQAVSGGVFRDWGEANTKWEGIIKIEDRKPMFGLKKLTVEERRKRHIGTADLVPNQKQRLLIKELNKEEKELGRSLYPEVE